MHPILSTKVIVLDDHPMIIDGVKTLLASYDSFQLSGVAHSWNELISKTSAEVPDILILDLNIKGKSILNKIEGLKAEFPKVKILIFSSYNTPTLVKKAFAQKVNGYLLKDTTQAEMLKALNTIRDDKIYVGQQVAMPVRGLNKDLKVGEIKDAFEVKNNLTERELDVIQLMIEGLSSNEIAERLFISRHTVQSHRKNILRKLNLHSAAEVVRFALQNKLV